MRARPGYVFRATRKRLEVLVLVRPLLQLGIELERSVERDARVVEPARARVDARKMEVQRRVIRVLRQPRLDLGDRTLGILVDDGVRHEEVLPRGHLVRAGFPTDRKHGRARLLGARIALHLGVT